MRNAIGVLGLGILLMASNASATEDGGSFFKAAGAWFQSRAKTTPPNPPELPGVVLPPPVESIYDANFSPTHMARLIEIAKNFGEKTGPQDSVLFVHGGQIKTFRQVSNDTNNFRNPFRARVVAYGENVRELGGGQHLLVGSAASETGIKLGELVQGGGLPAPSDLPDFHGKGFIVRPFTPPGFAGEVTHALHIEAAHIAGNHNLSFLYGINGALALARPLIYSTLDALELILAKSVKKV